jgi:hypothetical protein
LLIFIIREMLVKASFYTSSDFKWGFSQSNYTVSAI